MKPVKTWILLADGARARVFENLGPGKGLQHLPKLDMQQEPLQTRDIVSDQQGRSFSSASSARSAMEPGTDPAEKREEDFIKGVADRLASQLQRGAFDRLVVAAAPSALGDLRRHINDHVRKTILAELPKDLSNTPTKELPSHFADVLAL